MDTINHVNPIYVFDTEQIHMIVGSADGAPKTMICSGVGERR